AVSDGIPTQSRCGTIAARSTGCARTTRPQTGGWSGSRSTGIGLFKGAPGALAAPSTYLRFIERPLCLRGLSNEPPESSLLRLRLQIGFSGSQIDRHGNMLVRN